MEYSISGIRICWRIFVGGSCYFRGDFLETVEGRWSRSGGSETEYSIPVRNGWGRVTDGWKAERSPALSILFRVGFGGLGFGVWGNRTPFILCMRSGQFGESEYFGVGGICFEYVLRVVRGGLTADRVVLCCGTYGNPWHVLVE
ncbi:hypothetical protein AAC387_Pa02g3846 [Persea americana]